MVVHTRGITFIMIRTSMVFLPSRGDYVPPHPNLPGNSYLPFKSLKLWLRAATSDPSPPPNSLASLLLCGCSADGDSARVVHHQPRGQDLTCFALLALDPCPPVLLNKYC